MRSKLIKKEEEHKGGGIPEYYGKRYVGRVGKFYTSLVMDAWNAKLITMHNACEYLGIKKMQHLVDIRELRFGRQATSSSA